MLELTVIYCRIFFFFVFFINTPILWRFLFLRFCQF